MKILRVLLAAKALVNAAALDGTTPLYMAAHHGHSNAVTLLLSAKANADSEDKNGATPVYIAAQDGHVHEIQVKSMTAVCVCADDHRLAALPAALCVRAGASGCDPAAAALTF